MSKKIVAVLGTYRKNHVTESIVDEILNEAKQNGAEVEKILLVDKKIEFCTNCRNCTEKPGNKRGGCVLRDDMDSILDKIEASDAIILSSPVNFNNVTAITKRFMERLLSYYYYPFGSLIPKNRIKKSNKKVAFVTAAAAPSFYIYLFMDVLKSLKIAANMFAAKRVGTICMGFAAKVENPDLSEKTIRKAKKIAKKLL